MFAFLPLNIFEVNLRWLEAGQMPFFHQPLVNAFMRHLLGSPEDYEQCWAIHTPESGQLHYAAGDWYRFYCIALPRSSNSLCDSTGSVFGYSSQAQLFDQLSKLPHGDFVQNMRGQFGRTLQLVSIRDALTQQPLGSPQDALHIDQDSIEHEAEQWYELAPKTLTIELLSPMRISVPKTRGKGEQGLIRHPRQFDPNMLFMRAIQAIQQLHNDQADKGDKPPRLPFCDQPDWQVESKHQYSPLFWADCGYQSLRGENKNLGGLCGSASITINTPLNRQQWQYLVVGQYLGIGLSRGQGFGRYRLVSHDEHKSPQSTLLPFTRANSLYQQIIAGERIHSVGQEELQKSASQWLGESLDSLYSYASYGYRKGRSRLTVKDKIQQAWRDGYRWVVDADIRSFFQTVDIEQLLHKLEALYGKDPLWELIQSWLNTPINRDKLPKGYEAFQLKGLPLGSAMSLVLANLMLDDFASLIGIDKQECQAQVIRSADQFLIVCKNNAQAENIVLTIIRRDTGYPVKMYSLTNENL